MINREKVKLMTKIQLFENHEKEALKANRFFQHDYLGLYLIRSFLAYVVLYVLVLTVVFLYNWEELLRKVDLFVFMQAGKTILLSFVLLLIPSMIVSYIIYWFRYRAYRRKIKEYIVNLKQLNAFYQKDDQKEDKKADKADKAERFETADKFSDTKTAEKFNKAETYEEKT
ncbi:MAG: hypothetical protein Q4F21_03565 [Lachnospiraceae bacterium]|nr:hypothetical protein [Lachnospiraceae bacterium]